MPAKTNLSDSIQGFLSESRRYWNAVQMVALAAANRPIDGDNLIRLDGEKHEARAKLVRLGRPLAAMLEKRGTDSTPILKFMHTIDGGGGPPAAAVVWPDAKVLLQRLALTASGVAAVADTEEWLPADSPAVIAYVGKHKGRLTKLAKRDPSIRREATAADRTAHDRPALRYVYSRRRLFELTERPA